MTASQIRRAVRVGASVALLALLLPAPACAARPKRTEPALIEDALAFATADRSKAALLLEQAIEDPATPAADLPLLRLHAGEQRRLLGDLVQAREHFQAANDGDVGDLLGEAPQLGLALTELGADPLPVQLKELATFPEREALDTQNAERFLALALDAARADDAPRAKDYSRAALAYAKEHADVHERVESTLAAVAAGEAPPERGPEAPSDRIAGARAALAEGNVEKARRFAEEVLATAEPGSHQAMAAGYVLRRLERPVPVDPTRIGVLLPLSGKYEGVGKQMREALELGYGLGRKKLVFVDSGGTPTTAVAALEKLVLEQGVIGVVGPLLTDETEAVLAAAEAIGVPLVSLSQAVSDVSENDWVFRAMVTPEDQAEALVDYVMGTHGLQRFAIFAPDTNYGHTAAEVFTAAVTERGGAISVTTWYDAEATDLIPFAKALGRKDYEARKAEYYELRKLTKEKGGNPDRVVLPPILDFDAIFLPDKASRVPIATSALAYEEFPMGEFATVKDVPPLPLLGLNGWHDPTLVAQGGPYVRNGYFTDAYAALDPAGASFAEAYRAATGRTPNAIEAVVSDAGRLVAAAAASDARTWADFRAALATATVSGTATGTSGFEPDHAAGHAIRILTITRDAITQVHPPVEVVPAPGEQ